MSLLPAFRHLVSALLLLVGLLACGSGGGGSTPALLPLTPTVITAQPTDQSAVAGTAATFAVAATGATGYQWQRSTDGGATFAGVSSATATSYTTPMTVVSESGTKYRVVVSGTSNSVTSSVATLTVTAAPVVPAITVHPANQSVTAGQDASFSVTATGTSLAYQWQHSTDGGLTFTNLAGDTAATLTRTAVPLADNGRRYKVVVTNGLGSVTSNAALLTVNAAPAAPVFTTHPQNVSIVEGQNAQFTAVVTGTPVPTLQWQLSTDNGVNWSDISGATGTVFNMVAPVLANSGRQFRAVASNSGGSVNSNAAALTIAPAPSAPVFTMHPANQSVTEPAAATFTAAASGVPTPAFQWQQSSDNGGTWSNIVGAVAASYITPATAVADNGRHYRAVASNGSGSVTSQAALLTVTRPVPRFAYVANTGDNTVSTYIVNAATGQLRHSGYVATEASPHSVTVDPMGRFAYVANWGSNTVSAYTINASSGALTSAGTVPAGTWPYAVTVDPSGKFAYVANEASFNVSAYTIDGSTGALTSVGPPVAAERDPRSVTVDPTGKFAYVANASSNTVSAYTINASTGALTSVGSTVATGSTPQSVTVDPSGRFAYVANSVSNTVSAYAINASSGVLTGLGADVATGSDPASVAVDPSGRFAYVGNLSSHDVTAYTINATTGALTTIGTVSVLPSSARSITIDPSGKFVYVACEGYNTVAIFSINASTGALTSAGAVSGRSGVYSIAMTKGAVPVSYAPKFVYAASYGSGEVSAYRLNATTGTLTSVGALNPGGPLRSIATDPAGRFAYVTRETLFEGTPVVNVLSFGINASTGSLTSTGGPDGVASFPLSVAVDPSGRFAYVANQVSYSITIWTIDGATGALTTLGRVNTGNDPWSVCVDPSGRFVYVANQGSNSVSAFTINSSTGALTEIDQNGAAVGTTVAAGAAPSFVCVDPSGRFAYVANSGANSVSVFAINGSTGALTAAGAAVAVGLSPQSVGIDPLGRFVYVANANGNTVSCFSINASTGALTSAGSPVDTGGLPSSISIDPSGRFACVANAASNTVSVHAIDPSTGALTGVPGSPFPAGIGPVSVTTTGTLQ